LFCEHLNAIIDACPQLEQLGIALPMHPDMPTILLNKEEGATDSLSPLRIIASAPILHTLRVLCHSTFRHKWKECIFGAVLSKYARLMFRYLTEYGSGVKVRMS
jgi:hypothetical protein